jgi:NADH-quinone oxidoreductase subunit J
VHQLIFWILAVLTAVSSIAVVAVRNVVHAALALVGALMGVAGLFLLFGAEFVGLVQVLIYVGAVVVLFLFGIMLTSPRTGERVLDNSQRPLAALVALIIFAVLSAGILGATKGLKLQTGPAVSTRAVGQRLFTTWILPFEAVSMLLLAALIGAIVLARRE